MEDIDSTMALKEKLLTAGIEEMVAHGYADFSLRRVAAACGASCAAPYKHFKNKEDFINAIIAYVEEKWQHLSAQISSSYTSPAERIAELCLASVRFRVANPLYGKGSDSFKEELALSVEALCKDAGLDNAEERIFIVMALVKGAAALLREDAAENRPQTFELLRRRILAELA